MIPTATVGYAKVDVGLVVVGSVGPCGVLLLDLPSEGAKGMTSINCNDVAVGVVG